MKILKISMLLIFMTFLTGMQCISDNLVSYIARTILTIVPALIAITMIILGLLKERKNKKRGLKKIIYGLLILGIAILIIAFKINHTLPQLLYVLTDNRCEEILDEWNEYEDEYTEGILDENKSAFNEDDINNLFNDNDQ